MEVLNPGFNFPEYYKRHQKRSLILFDYDGTLAPHIEDRLHAFPYEGIVERLQKLMSIKKNRVIIVSGRNLDTLKHLLKLDLYPELWGSHGLEREIGGSRNKITLNSGFFEGLEKAKLICQNLAYADYCEEKPYSTALHWRGIEKTPFFGKVEEEWNELTRNYPFELHHFEDGIEFRAKGINKGDAIKQLKVEEPLDAAFVYFGDDITDEDAFAVMGPSDLKVLVRQEERPTKADLLVTPNDELKQFIDKLIEVPHGSSN